MGDRNEWDQEPFYRGDEQDHRRRTGPAHFTDYRAMKLGYEVLARAKALSARERKSLTCLIEEGLRLRLRSQAPQRSKRRAKLPVYQGRGGMAAGVDPTSNRAMFEAAGDEP